MSKNALGSRPSFNNVAKATGDLALDIDFNNDLEETNPLLIDADNEEEQKRRFKEKHQEETLREMREGLKELEKETITETLEKEYKDLKKEDITVEPKKEDNRPSTKKHLSKGYTRATFAVKDEHLELIKALALYKNLEQKELLEAILEDALKKISKDIKEEALAKYREKEEKGKQTIKDLFN